MQNDIVKKRREYLQMSQKEYATFLDIKISVLCAIENLTYDKHNANTLVDSAMKIALDCECDIENILPDSLKGFSIKPILMSREIDPQCLLAHYKHSGLLGNSEADLNETERKKYALDMAINRLTNRERIVISMRHGDIEYSYSEIGKKLCLSVERARQIHGKALRKLRKNPHIDMLSKDYIAKNTRSIEGNKLLIEEEKTVDCLAYSVEG